MPEHDPLERRLDMAERRIRDLEEAFQKVNYALFGLQGDNGLIGSLAKLAEGQQQINKRITDREEKDDSRWDKLQWKFVGGLAAIILMLVPILVAVLAQS